MRQVNTNQLRTQFDLVKLNCSECVFHIDQWDDFEANVRKIQHEIGELKNKNHQLDVYAHMLGHDLLAPLRNAQNYLNIAANHANDHDVVISEIHTAIMNAQTNLKLMSGLISDLRELTKGRVSQLSAEEINIPNLLDSILILHQEIIENNNVKINFQGATSFFGYRTLIWQLFDNLVRNAVIHGRQEDEISIEFEQKDSEFILRVENRIPYQSKDQEVDFQLFAPQAESQNSGTGMGAYICQQIAKVFNGNFNANIKNERYLVYCTLQEVREK